MMPLAILAALVMCPDARSEESSAESEFKSSWVTSIAGPHSIEALAPDAKFVAATATGLLLRPSDVVSFTTADAANRTVLYSHPAAVWRVVMTDDGKTVASVDYRGNLMTYDMASGETKTFEKAFERWSQAFIQSPDQKFLLAGNEAGKIISWDIAAGKVAKSAELDGHAVTGLTISPDGKTVAASDGGGHVHLLSWPNLESAGKIEFGEEPAWCVAFINDGKQLLVGSGDRNLYQCDASDGAKTEAIVKGTDWITTIAVSPGGQVAAGEVGGRVHFPRGSADAMTAASGIWSLAWNGDNQLLVGTRKNGIVAAGQTWTWTTADGSTDE